MIRNRLLAVAALIGLLGIPAAAQQQGSTGGTVPTIGPANINVSSGANATNIGTGSTTGNVTLGGASNAVVLPGTPGFAALCLTAAGGTGIGSCANGTWTPTVTTDGTAGTPAYTTQVGNTEQIGRQISVRFTIVLSGWTGSPTGNILIGGLPQAATSTANQNGACVVTQYTVTGLAASTTGITGVISPSATTVKLFSQGNTGTSQVTAAQAGSTPTLIGICTYST